MASNNSEHNNTHIHLFIYKYINNNKKTKNNKKSIYIKKCQKTNGKISNKIGYSTTKKQRIIYSVNKLIREQNRIVTGIEMGMGEIVGIELDLILGFCVGF